MSPEAVWCCHGIHNNSSQHILSSVPYGLGLQIPPTDPRSWHVCLHGANPRRIDHLSVACHLLPWGTQRNGLHQKGATTANANLQWTEIHARKPWCKRTKNPKLICKNLIGDYWKFLKFNEKRSSRTRKLQMIIRTNNPIRFYNRLFKLCWGWKYGWNNCHAEAKGVIEYSITP